MGTDSPESMRFKLNEGNNVHINLEPDTRADTDRLFAALSEGGTVQVALQEMFWGAFWGCLSDRCGARWMFASPIARPRSRLPLRSPRHLPPRRAVAGLGRNWQN